ncbi:sugar ABC transporter ATP-binding protein [Suicoccus acidiformans]|uniref:Sugar ABC transporter ATP-binding protein n=1 Tax=Suicoccus acidiformans TaxID=2036206 RepID=A0A347WID7_9LACT|nr:ABC transporter ATP-binding protein [Suicoccus acidiformans]AXY24844.1 sugar ABC transporter ATP-binding protein [Suicoccus acidiformans]
MKQSNTLSRLIRDVSQPLWSVCLALLGTGLQVGLTIYMPVLIGRALDQTIAAGQVNFTALVAILQEMALVMLANALVQLLNPLIYNRLVYRAIERLRNQVLSKIHRLPLSYLDQRATGELVSRVTTDTEQLADGLLMVFNQFFVGILTILVTIVTMARLDWLMMLLVVLLTPISLFVSRFIANRSYQYFQLQTQYRGEHASFVEETIQQGEIIRLFNQQAVMNERFRQVNTDYLDASQSAIFYSSTVNPTTRFINALIYALLALFGVWRIMKGSFTVGQLATFLNYANQYTKPFNDISNVLAEIQSALACAERLYAIIDQPDEAETGYYLYQDGDVDGAVAFNQASFSYQPDKPLIERLTLSIQPGQTVAIVGPTGAGKSTMINLLMRFYDLDGGQILIDGEPATDYTRDAVRSQFGMVLQETWLKTGTIHENIAYGYPQASREEVVAAARSAHADHFISLLPEGYDTKVGEGGVQLSTGQEQLLAIARIFVRLPNMLILDEATSSIDTRTEIFIQDAFDALMEGRTSFIIAHRLSTIQNADVILVMNQGRIVEQGNHEALMQSRGFYYRMQVAQDAIA